MSHFAPMKWEVSVRKALLKIAVYEMLTPDVTFR